MSYQSLIIDLIKKGTCKVNTLVPHLEQEEWQSLYNGIEQELQELERSNESMKLERVKEYIQTHSTIDKMPLYQFPPLLHKDRVNDFYNMLIENRCLPTSTKRESLMYVFGLIDEAEEKQVQWLENQQMLRVLLKCMYRHYKPFTQIEECVPMCFVDKNGYPKRLQKNQERYTKKDLERVFKQFFGIETKEFEPFHHSIKPTM